MCTVNNNEGTQKKKLKIKKNKKTESEEENMSDRGKSIHQ